LAKKKKQAVDNLYITGKISQFTRDSFNKDISTTIVEIERQQKDLLEKMQLKTDELSCQIKTLESLLANYEIQYVVGEIEEEAYKRDIFLLSAGIDAAKNELETIQHATMQLCGSVPTVQAPVPPELPIAPTPIETHAVECTPTEEAMPVELSPIETPVESPLTIETPVFEAAPVPITEIIEEQPFVTETPVEESVMESAPVDAFSVVEEPTAEEATLFEETPVVEESVVEVAPVETSAVETPVAEAALPEAVPVEEPTMVSDFSVVEEPTVEADLFATETPLEETTSVISETETADEQAIKITATDPVFLNTEPTVEAPAMDYPPAEETLIETIPVTEAPFEEITTEETTITDVPLQVFEVTEQAPIEQTLEKVMEQLNSPVVETLTVEELTHDSHPSTAPHQAPSDIIAEAISDGQIDENDEDTTE